MIEMTDNEKIERAKLYRGSNTKTYVKDKFGYFCNGKIILVDDVKLIIKDQKIGDVPIKISDIDKIEPSRGGRG